MNKYLDIGPEHLQFRFSRQVQKFKKKKQKKNHILKKGWKN